MSKISCDVCSDLIPLVKNDVASDDSKRLVLEHLEKCDTCNEIYKLQSDVDFQLDNAKVSQKTKRNLQLVTLVIIGIGIFVGIIITNGMYVFYNVLIMPFIGFLGYLIF